MTTKELRRRTRSATSSEQPTAFNLAAGSECTHPGLQLQVEYVATATLRPARRRLRKKVARQLVAVESAMRAFGFMNPILVDPDRRIVCGHNRWASAQKLGLEQVPDEASRGASSENQISIDARSAAVRADRVQMQSFNVLRGRGENAFLQEHNWNMVNSTNGAHHADSRCYRAGRYRQCAHRAVRSDLVDQAETVTPEETPPLLVAGS